jgi:uncharacterized protein YndB with AHSA1/START domain
MTTRKHIHEEIFHVDPETLFALLHTPSAIRRWWGASRVIVDPKSGGVWVGLWGEEDSPDYSGWDKDPAVPFVLSSVTRRPFYFR